MAIGAAKNAMNSAVQSNGLTTPTLTNSNFDTGPWGAGTPLIDTWQNTDLNYAPYTSSNIPPYKKCISGPANMEIIITDNGYIIDCMPTRYTFSTVGEIQLFFEGQYKNMESFLRWLPTNDILTNTTETNYSNVAKLFCLENGVVLSFGDIFRSYTDIGDFIHELKEILPLPSNHEKFIDGL